MKKRIFYIVHLDKERILILSILSGTLLLSSFTIGYKMGKDQMLEFSKIQIPVPEQKSHNPMEEINIGKIEEDISSTSKKVEKDSKNISTLELKEKNISIEELKKAKPIELESQNFENKTDTEEIKKVDDWKPYKKPFSTENTTKKTETYDFLIQIAAFRNEKDAINLKEKLKKYNISAFYKKKKSFYITYTTAKSKSELENIKEELERLNYKNTIVKKLNN